MSDESKTKEDLLKELELLRGRVSELEELDAERKEAEYSLREAIEFNEALLKTIPFGMDIVDESGNILFLTENLKELFGEKVIGKKCWDIYKDNGKQCLHCPLHEINKLEDGHPQTMETQGVLGGKTFLITHRLMEFEGKRAVLEIFQDITENKKAEQEIKRNLSDLQQFKEMTIDRENIMIELKKEVNQLCVKS